MSTPNTQGSDPSAHIQINIPDQQDSLNEALLQDTEDQQIQQQQQIQSNIDQDAQDEQQNNLKRDYCIECLNNNKKRLILIKYFKIFCFCFGIISFFIVIFSNLSNFLDIYECWPALCYLILNIAQIVFGQQTISLIDFYIDKLKSAQFIPQNQSNQPQNNTHQNEHTNVITFQVRDPTPPTSNNNICSPVEQQIQQQQQLQQQQSNLSNLTDISQRPPENSLQEILQNEPYISLYYIKRDSTYDIQQTILNQHQKLRNFQNINIFLAFVCFAFALVLMLLKIGDYKSDFEYLLITYLILEMLMSGILVLFGVIVFVILVLVIVIGILLLPFTSMLRKKQSERKKKYISKFKFKTYKHKKIKNQLSTPEECSICLEKYQDDDDLLALNCGQQIPGVNKHAFHLDCMKQMLINDNKCPLCRYNIDIEEYKA